MASGQSKMKPEMGSLPEFLHSLFWDMDFFSLDWESDRNLIVRRILLTGGWPAIRWLRTTWGDANLRSWLQKHAGGHLGPRQIRYWELVLNLPAQAADVWVAKAKKSPWERRVQP